MRCVTQEWGDRGGVWGVCLNHDTVECCWCCWPSPGTRTLLPTDQDLTTTPWCWEAFCDSEYNVLRVSHQLGPRNTYRTVVITDSTCIQSGNQTTWQQIVHNGVAHCVHNGVTGTRFPLCHWSNNKYCSEKKISCLSSSLCKKSVLVLLQYWI